MQRLLFIIITTILTAICAFADDSAPPASVNINTEVAPIIQNEFNGCVLAAIREMPSGGGYATNRKARAALVSALSIADGRLKVGTSGATPSYCSGATYLVFCRALAIFHNRHAGDVSENIAEKLLIKSQGDGIGVWGRWNANGPGTACLVASLHMGDSFERMEDAVPGDFMKIFWTDDVGSLERGHSVVFLGLGRDVKGAEVVRFWSSNQPGGYGAKDVARNKIRWCIITRITRPNEVRRVTTLAGRDELLVSMLKKSYTQADIRKELEFLTLSSSKPSIDNVRTKK